MLWIEPLRARRRARTLLSHGQIIERGDDVIVPIVAWADTPTARTRGLLGRSEIVTSGAFILCGAKQVHTFGLDRDIDVAFCDRLWNVLYVARRMRPNRVGRPVLNARYAIEACAGALDRLERGDRLTVRDL